MKSSRGGYVQSLHKTCVIQGGDKKLKSSQDALEGLLLFPV